MFFLVLFTLGALAVPLAWDIGRHGSDNILRRSGRDLLTYPVVARILRQLHVTTGRVSTVALSIGSLAVLVLAGYVGLKTIDFIGSIVSIIRW